MCQPVCPSVLLTVCQSVEPSESVSVYPSDTVSVYPSDSSSACLSFWQYVCLSLWHYVCLSFVGVSVFLLAMWLSVQESVSLSISLLLYQPTKIHSDSNPKGCLFQKTLKIPFFVYTRIAREDDGPRPSQLPPYNSTGRKLYTGQNNFTLQQKYKLFIFNRKYLTLILHTGCKFYRVIQLYST